MAGRDISDAGGRHGRRQARWLCRLGWLPVVAVANMAADTGHVE